MDQQLVRVDWEDSAQPVSGWVHLSDLPDLAVIRCSSVGWVVAEDAAVLMLAPNLGDQDSEVNAQASGIIRIPRRCVTRMTPLVEAAATSSSA